MRIICTVVKDGMCVERREPLIALHVRNDSLARSLARSLSAAILRDHTHSTHRMERECVFACHNEIPLTLARFFPLLATSAMTIITVIIDSPVTLVDSEQCLLSLSLSHLRQVDLPLAVVQTFFASLSMITIIKMVISLHSLGDMHCGEWRVALAFFYLTHSVSFSDLFAPSLLSSSSSSSPSSPSFPFFLATLHIRWQALLRARWLWRTISPLLVYLPRWAIC